MQTIMQTNPELNTQANQSKSQSKSQSETQSETQTEEMFDLQEYCRIEFPKDIVSQTKRGANPYHPVKIVNKNDYKTYQPSYYFAQ